jgi:glyoxylase-like metal-dependent hydrolase (beta-lactamase superfamily II)
MNQVTVLDTGFFKLDGGAMFGVVPKTMWQKLNPPDESNLCTWAMRCLLVENGDRKILVDTGIGNKQDDKFRSHFHPHGSDSLTASLRQKGLSPEDITDVFLTHLHFDHCGGALLRDSAGRIVPAFPNATYWSNQRHFDWACKPNAREQASFLSENFVPLAEAGVLRMVEEDGQELFEGFHAHWVYGHTEAMMLPEIRTATGSLLYCADLMPSEAHLGLPYVMAYDVRPLDSLREKEHFLHRAVDEPLILFFEHSPTVECATVARNDKGRIIADRMGKLGELMGGRR